MSIIRLAMIEERTANVAAEVIAERIYQRFNTDDLAIRTAAEVNWDEKVTEENIDDVLKSIGELTGQGSETAPEKTAPEATDETEVKEDADELEEELEEIREDLDDLKNSENNQTELLNKMMDMVMSLLDAKPKRKTNKKANQEDIEQATDAYIRLAYDLVAKVKPPKGYKPMKDGKGFVNNKGQTWYPPKSEGKKEPVKEEKAPEETAPKQEAPQRKSLLDNVKPLDKPAPSWHDENNPLDPKNKGQMKERGFTDLKPGFKIKDDTEVVNPRTGKSYRFGDLPDKVKQKMVAKAEQGGLMKAPSAAPKEEAPKEEAPKEEAPKEEAPKEKAPKKTEMQPLEPEDEDEDSPIVQYAKAHVRKMIDQELAGMFSPKKGVKPAEHHAEVTKTVAEKTGLPEDVLNDSIQDTIKTIPDEKKKELATGDNTVDDVYVEIVKDTVEQAAPRPTKRDDLNLTFDESGKPQPPKYIKVGKGANAGVIPFDKMGKASQNDYMKMLIENAKEKGTLPKAASMSERVASRFIFAEEPANEVVEPKAMKEKKKSKTKKRSQGEDEEKKKKVDGIVTRVMEKLKEKKDEAEPAEDLVVACVKKGARGLQMNRKDKDMISDTGGGSYKRTEPKQKPPRDDVSKPFSKKNKKPSDRDDDVDNDADLNKSASIVDRVASVYIREATENGYSANG